VEEEKAKYQMVEMEKRAFPPVIKKGEIKNDFLLR